ncbi:MAG: folate-binding protein [Cyanobacteria bacterium J06632_3]
MNTSSIPALSANTLLPQQPALFDRSHWGRIVLTDRDRVRFLHNQTTNNIEQLTAGQGCYTTFVTSTGRTIDLATVYAFPDALLVTVSPGMTQQIYDWMDRYIFFSDKVTLTDKSEETFLFTVLGDGCDAVLKALGSDDLVGQSPFTHQTIAIPETDLNIQIAVGSDLAIAGYTLWGPKEHADTLWQLLQKAGAQPATAQQWEQLRIQQGRPVPTQELTDDDNPLEAGLWNSISFEKGCYIGQETIARLNTYQGVKKRLWGIYLEESPEVGTALTLLESNDAAPAVEQADSTEPPKAGSKIGKLTSITHTETGAYGLAYVRTKAGGAGLSVSADGIVGQLVPVPFVSHQYYSNPDKGNSGKS